MSLIQILKVVMDGHHGSQRVNYVLQIFYRISSTDGRISSELFEYLIRRAGFLTRLIIRDGPTFSNRRHFAIWRAYRRDI